MEQFSIRVGRSATINGRLLASMDEKKALAHFKKSRFSEEQIKKAHSEAVAKAKELDGSSEAEKPKTDEGE